MSITSTNAIRVVGVGSAAGLVIASAGFGSVYAYSVGIELLAGLSVLMALALEGVKPLAISSAFRAFSSFSLIRGLLLTVLGLVAVAYSLTAELALMATSKGDLIAERQASSERSKATRDHVSGIHTELTSLGLTRPSGAISGELSAILSDKRLNGCEGWLENWRLRQTCIEKVSPLKDELAKAQRREALQGELKATQTTADKTADPGATALATYLATLGLSIPVAILSQWLTLVPVLALEIGSALAVLLVQALPKGEPQPIQQIIAPERGLRDEAATAIENQLKAHGGSLNRSERGLAKLVGADRSTVRRAIQGLAIAGLITIEAVSRSGTQIKLLSKIDFC